MHTTNEIRILDALRSKFQGKTNGFISLTELQRSTQISRPTVIRHLRALENKNVIKKTLDRGEDGSHLVNFYELYQF
jgi:uncharacterized membrane protein